MPLEAKSKLFKHKKAETLYLTLPARLSNDSAFPFEAGEEVEIKIKNKRLIIEGIE